MKMRFKIQDKEYPCMVTLGAMVRFHDETGRDISEIDNKNFTEMCMFIYCCVASACNREKIEFPYDFYTFVDMLEPDCVNSFYTELEATQKKAKRPVANQ